MHDRVQKELMEILILELIVLENLRDRQRHVSYCQHVIHIRLNEFPRGRDHDDLRLLEQLRQKKQQTNVP
jgi:hypothetical protein